MAGAPDDQRHSLDQSGSLPAINIDRVLINMRDGESSPVIEASDSWIALVGSGHGPAGILPGRGGDPTASRVVLGLQCSR